MTASILVVKVDVQTVIGGSVLVDGGRTLLNSEAPLC